MFLWTHTQRLEFFLEEGRGTDLVVRTLDCMYSNTDLSHRYPSLQSTATSLSPCSTNHCLCSVFLSFTFISFVWIWFIWSGLWKPYRKRHIRKFTLIVWSHGGSGWDVSVQWSVPKNQHLHHLMTLMILLLHLHPPYHIHSPCLLKLYIFRTLHRHHYLSYLPGMYLW